MGAFRTIRKIAKVEKRFACVSLRKKISIQKIVLGVFLVLLRIKKDF